MVPTPLSQRSHRIVAPAPYFDVLVHRSGRHDEYLAERPRYRHFPTPATDPPDTFRAHGAFAIVNAPITRTDLRIEHLFD
jgi:hypothetical protein